MLNPYDHAEADLLAAREMMERNLSAELCAAAGEVGHWAVLGKLNESAGEEQLTELVSWATPPRSAGAPTSTPASSIATATG